MDLGERIAQLKGSARIDAEKDPRNSFAMAAMIEALCKHLSPAMLFNWDATQYALSPDKDEIWVYQKGKDFGPLTSESGGGTFLSIKHCHFHNASCELLMHYNGDCCMSNSLPRCNKRLNDMIRIKLEKGDDYLKSSEVDCT